MAIAQRADQHIRVMLADDHAVFRLGLRELLEEDTGVCVVAEAETGEEAVERALAGQPDVVLMDVRMPGKDGIQATREIKAKLPHTEVVVLSGFADEDQVVQALEAGARAFVVKDDDPAAMLRAVHSVSAGRLYLGPSLAKRVLQRLAAAPAPPREMTQQKRVNGHSELTPRETHVLRLLAEGRKAREMAATLEISERTVRNHLRNIFAKLRLTNRTQAIIYAVRTGLIKL